MLSRQKQQLVDQYQDGEWKAIPLTQGKFAIVDKEDYEELSKYKWHCQKKSRVKKYWQACRMSRVNGKRKVIKMHRQITNAPKGMVVDHINGDSLDNRRSNLRVCSNQQNVMHRVGLSINNKSGVRGVRFYPRYRKWHAQIEFNGKKYHLGYFSRKEIAVQSWKEKARELSQEYV